MAEKAITEDKTKTIAEDKKKTIVEDKKKTVADEKSKAILDEKRKAIDLAVGNIEKLFGKGSVMRLGDASKFKVDAISTGALSLDIALGVGGLPRGRIIEVFGPEAGGKTTVALHIIAEVQKKGGVAAFIDAEHALDPSYAQRIGVDLDNLLISQPSTGEEALEITEMLVRSNAIEIVVIDSVAALVPKAEIEGDMGDLHIGTQARLMSQALRKLTAITGKSNSIVVFINQIREKIGVMFGNPEVTTGGRALRFYSSIRLEVRRIESIKRDGNDIGNRVKVKVVKNKVAPPFKQVELDIIFGEGISSVGCVFDLAVEHGFLTKSGTWFAYNNNNIGQGKDNSKEYLKAHPEVWADLETKLRKLLLTTDSNNPVEKIEEVVAE